MVRLAARDPDALALLYDRTRRLVYSLALRILGRPEDAEDITLETYTQVWRDAGRYESRRGSVEAWLITIARTRAIDRLRLRAARPDMQRSRISIPDALAHIEAFVGSSEVWETRERAAEMLRMLAPDERRLIMLAFFDGYTHTELAAKLGMPLGTVKTRIRASLQRMRRALEDRERRPPDPWRLVYTSPRGVTDVRTAMFSRDSSDCVRVRDRLGERRAPRARFG